jgi:hypothetical protein
VLPDPWTARSDHRARSGKRVPGPASRHHTRRSLDQVPHSLGRGSRSPGEVDDPGARSSIPGPLRAILVAITEIVVAITEIVVPPIAPERRAEGAEQRSKRK